MDVGGTIFSRADYDALHCADANCLLLNITGEITEAEQAYIKWGEEKGLPERYLLANRRPWFSMEQRAPAPIWAAVFGRGNLGFVYNEANARSLTNFHCVYPEKGGEQFARALTAALNSSHVREDARQHIRGYGGGLMKFEPNDLKCIQVPDLNHSRTETVERLSTLLDFLDETKRQGVGKVDELDELVLTAGMEAAGHSGILL